MAGRVAFPVVQRSDGFGSLTKRRMRGDIGNTLRADPDLPSIAHALKLGFSVDLYEKSFRQPEYRAGLHISSAHPLR